MLGVGSGWAGLKCAEMTCCRHYQYLLDFKTCINTKKNWDPLELQFPVDSVLPLT